MAAVNCKPKTGPGHRFTEPAVRSLAWRKRYPVVGFAAGSTSIPLNLPLLTGAYIVGVFWGLRTARTEAGRPVGRQLLQWITAGQLKQHIHKPYLLADAPVALRDLLDRKVIGKAVVIIDLP